MEAYLQPLVSCCLYTTIIRQEKENSEFKPVKLRLKTDLVSYPARAEGLVNSIRQMIVVWRQHETSGRW